MIPPRCDFIASPPGGHRWRTGAAGSAAVAGLVVALSGCDSPLQATGYFPLEAGHRWVYDQASEWDNNSAERETLELSTLGEDRLASGPAMRRRSASGMDYWLRADGTGIFRVASKSDVQEEPQPDPAPRYVLKEPLAVGTQWQASTTAYLLRRRNEFPPEIRHTHAPVPMTYTIEAVGQKLATRAGQFDDCLRVRGQAVMKLFADPVVGWKELPLATTEWYCKGVGLVKLERSEPASSTFLVGGTLRMELVSWQ
ncbi:hypothetical protein BurJ1DRAFT_1102 [Burkholderiales bacterium JOSHI_001]|nr:hypothetical protein BurJ1DRAFT_1102 [Burkholderiales bacterium JOSHI_001]